MNIFFLSMNPQKAATWHCDQHVVKMILESTQLLWTAQHVAYQGRIPDIDDAPTTRSGVHGYRATHKNHPSAIWTRASIANYMWLCDLATALIAEYHYRWTARPPHACEAHVAWLRAHPPPLASTSLTWPALAMPEEFKISRNPTACYRAYYRGPKRVFARYTRREPPTWLSISY